jgi:hypothetical protein
MLTEEEGIKAIIALQAVVGITETEEQARKGWNSMANWEKQSTEDAYNMVCKGGDN